MPKPSWASGNTRACHPSSAIFAQTPGELLRNAIYEEEVKGDLVQVVTGADRGKQGHVISVDVAYGAVQLRSRLNAAAITELECSAQTFSLMGVLSAIKMAAMVL